MTYRNFVSRCVVIALLAIGAFGTATAQAPGGSVTIVTIIDVLSNANVPGNVESSNALLNKLVADTKQAPGVESIKILRDAGRSNHFIILAVFKDLKSYEDYRASATTRAFREAFQPKLGGPFDERIYVDLK